MHADALPLDAELARTLVDTQFPRWRDLPLVEVRGTGTVNAIHRLGDGLAVRFPWRSTDRADLVREADACRELAAVATVPTPSPVALGAPTADYPSAWSVQTWLPGRDALAEDPAVSTAFAGDLASLIGALRAVPTHGRRFAHSGRGGHLPDHDEWVEHCLRESEPLFDVRPFRALWAELRGLPEVDDDAMCHGDLTPANLLVDDGRLAGVLDGGSFGPADPALDLVCAWHLLDAGPRAVLRQGLGSGDVQWLRGKAWALQQALGLVWYYAETNPVTAAWGRRTLERLATAWPKTGTRSSLSP